MNAILLLATALNVMIPPVGVNEQNNPSIEEKVRMTASGFLADIFSGVDAVRLMDERRAQDILRTVDGGAADYGAESRLQTLRRFAPVDVVFAYHLDKPGDQASAAILEAETGKGVAKRTTNIPRDGRLTSEFAKALADLAAEALGADAALKRRFSDLAARRGPVLSAVYLAPRVCTRLGGNQSELRFGFVSPALSKAKADPAVAYALVDAGDWAQKPRQGIPSDPNYRPQNVVTLAKDAFETALACDDPLKTQWFVKGAWPSVGDKVIALAESGARGAVGRMMDEALEVAAGVDDMMDEMTPVPAKEATTPAFSKDDAVRGALVVLGEMQAENGLKVLIDVAAAQEASMRLAVAVSLGGYTNAAATAQTLTALWKDADASVAVAADRSMRRCGILKQPALTAARKLLDAKTAPTSMKGFDPVAAALEILATDGGAEDRARFELFAGDCRVARRVAAARGLVARCGAEEARRFLDDIDSSVVHAALKAVPYAALKAEPALFAAVAALADDHSNLIANEAFSRISECRPTDAPAAQAFDLSHGHPYVRRQILADLAAKGDAEAVAVIEKTCASVHPQSRARALGHLVRLAPRRAHPLLVKAIGDMHGWVRLHAAAALATRAEAADRQAIAAAQAKEKDPAIRLYLADALAKAEGRPAPAPQPAALPILGRQDAPVWICGFNEVGPDRSPFTAYYTCREPVAPTVEQKRKHDAGAPAMTRPNPLGNFGDPGTVMTDRTAADFFWTKLRKDFTKEILDCTDAILLGEESMSFGGGAIWWSGGARLFCAEAGLDYAVVEKANGGQAGLTENQKKAAKDFAYRISVEGFNEIYDFIHIYFGKLRPGLIVATGLRGEHATYLKETTAISPYDLQWKFDLGGAYEYEGDWRYMYAKCRAFRTIWPDRPMFWLSYGNTDYGVGPCYGQKPTNWLTPWPTNAPAYRWDHAYVDNLAVWMAGADPGFYALYSLYPPGSDRYSIGTVGSAEPEPESIFPGSFVVESGIDKMFSKKTEELLQTEMEGKQKPKIDVSLEDDGDDNISLEEKTGPNSALGRRFAAMRKAARNGLLYCEHAMENAARAEIGLPRIDPVRYPTLVAGPSLWICYTPAAMLTDGFDAQQYLPLIPAGGGLERYSLVILGNCQKTPMDEATRLEFLRWLKGKPGVLVVTGMVSDDVPVYNVRHLDGDLRTPWPWKGGIELIPADGQTKRPARYRVTGEGFTAIEKDEHGVARCTWSQPGYKGLVVFELLNSRGKAPEGEAAVESMRKLLSGFYAKNGVDFPLREAAGGLSRTVGPLHVEILSDHSKAEKQMKGCELLTGQWNPKLTPRLNAAMVTEDYVAPFVAVHGGVCVFSEDKRLEVVEKLANGLKVKVNGLVRVTTRSGRPVKVVGAKLPVFQGDVGDWMLWGKEDGLATLPARNVVQLMDQPDRTDNVPAATVIRHAGILTITD